MPDSLYSMKASEKLRKAYFNAKNVLRLWASLQTGSSQQLPSRRLVCAPDQNITAQELQRLLEQLRSDGLSDLPEVEVVSRLSLRGGWSQHSLTKNKIYLARDFVEKTTESLLMTVLLQEMMNALRSSID